MNHFCRRLWNNFGTPFHIDEICLTITIDWAKDVLIASQHLHDNRLGCLRSEKWWLRRGKDDISTSRASTDSKVIGWRPRLSEGWNCEGRLKAASNRRSLSHSLWGHESRRSLAKVIFAKVALPSRALAKMDAQVRIQRDSTLKSTCNFCGETRNWTQISRNTLLYPRLCCFFPGHCM